MGWVTDVTVEDCGCSLRKRTVVSRRRSLMMMKLYIQSLYLMCNNGRPRVGGGR